MTEILKTKGRLLEEEQRARELNLRGQGLLRSLRDLLDPFDELEDMKVDVAVQEALQLAHIQIEYKECLAKIREMKKYLRT